MKFGDVSGGSDVDGLFLSRQQAVHGSRHGLHVDLSNCARKNMNDLLVGRGHHTLPVNLDDAVAHSDSTPFCNTPPHQTADNAILYAEAELVPEVWSADEDHGDWRTSNNVHLNPGLRLQALDDALAGGQRQTHQTRPVHRHDLISDVETARFRRRSSVHQTGDDDGG